MSYFGVNIKKIRTVKKLSQQQFAKLFNLTRSAVGSYEEGRAEPKIDKVIEIANYFNLSLDQLLKKRLTVNEILNFKPNYFDNYYEIPYVDKKSIKKFIKSLQQNNVSEKFPKICLPNFFPKISVAFEFMEYHKIFYNTILLCSDDLEKPYPYFLAIDNDNLKIINKPTGNYSKIYAIGYVLYRDISKLNLFENIESLTYKIDAIADFIKLRF